MNFLHWHFVRFMDAYKDGLVRSVTADDLRFRLPPKDEAGAAAVYCIVNDLDNDCVPELLEAWRELRRREPPPIPPNIILGET